jgi:hypothetical protein
MITSLRNVSGHGTPVCTNRLPESRAGLHAWGYHALFTAASVGPATVPGGSRRGPDAISTLFASAFASNTEPRNPFQQNWATHGETRLCAPDPLSPEDRLCGTSELERDWLIGSRAETGEPRFERQGCQVSAQFLPLALSRPLS